jgi:hypothetical protein
MKPDFTLLSAFEVEAARVRRLEGMAVQEIEENPLSADQTAMFEMFERERWSHARRREHLAARVVAESATMAG